MKTGLLNVFKDDPVLDWADRPQSLQTAILSSIFDIKLNPADTAKLRQFELMERRRNQITDEDFKQEQQRLIELNKKVDDGEVK